MRRSRRFLSWLVPTLDDRDLILPGTDQGVLGVARAAADAARGTLCGAFAERATRQKRALSLALRVQLAQLVERAYARILGDSRVRAAQRDHAIPKGNFDELAARLEIAVRPELLTHFAALLHVA